jgi:hypothetical protein
MKTLPSSSHQFCSQESSITSTEFGRIPQLQFCFAVSGYRCETKEFGCILLEMRNGRASKPTAVVSTPGASLPMLLCYTDLFFTVLCSPDLEVTGIHPSPGIFKDPFNKPVLKAESVLMCGDQVPLAIFRDANIFLIPWAAKRGFDHNRWSSCRKYDTIVEGLRLKTPEYCRSTVLPQCHWM